MKPVYHHYTKWEDFQNGMYNEEKEGRRERVLQAKELLRDTDNLYIQMKKVSEQWKYACEQTFTQNFNHQAFLGQCACDIYAGIKEDETREAWGLLTNEERYAANKVADIVYDEWLTEYEKSQDKYQTSLF